MQSVDNDGEGPYLKPASFLINSVELRKALDRRCGGCRRHAHLPSGRAAAAQVYPEALCRAIVNGIIKQAQHDAAELMTIECAGLLEIDAVHHDLEGSSWKRYWDDLSGQELDSALTAEDRAEEIREIHNMGSHKEVTIEECLRQTGRLPVAPR